MSRIQELEEQVNSLRKGLKSDAVKIADNEALGSEIEQLRAREKTLTTELQNIKAKESQSSQEKRELEATVSSLEERLVKFRALEVECESLQELNSSLQEEAETLEIKLQESITERQLAEQHTSQIFDTLKKEREAKHKLEEHLAEMEANQTVTRLGLKPLGKEMSPKPEFVSNEEEEIAEQSLCNELQVSLDMDPSELLRLENELGSLKEKYESVIKQLQEYKKCYEENNRVIEKLEGEKTSLTNELDMARTVTETGALCGQLKAERELAGLRHEHTTLLNSSGEEIRFLKGKIESLEKKEQKLKTLVAALESEKSSLSLKGESLQSRIHDIERVSSVQMAALEEDLRRLRESHTEQTEVTAKLQKEFTSQGHALEDAENGLKETKTDMMTVIEELSGLCRYVRVLSGDTDSKTDEATDTESNNESSGISLGASCLQLVARVKVQTRSLKQAVERPIQMMLERSSISHSDDINSGHAEELEKRVGHLQRQLASKKEEIATLKVLLRASKTASETSSHHAKSRFEDEKKVLEKEIDHLKAEMQAMIQRESEFNNLRSVFASRCDEYVSQLTELNDRLDAAEKEKVTLEGMLSQTIKQKLAARQKLEEYEIERERLYSIPRKLSSSRI
jgi:protein bicaudal D